MNTLKQVVREAFKEEREEYSIVIHYTIKGKEFTSVYTDFPLQSIRLKTRLLSDDFSDQLIQVGTGLTINSIIFCTKKEHEEKVIKRFVKRGTEILRSPTILEKKDRRLFM